MVMLWAEPLLVSGPSMRHQPCTLTSDENFSVEAAPSPRTVPRQKVSAAQQAVNHCISVRTRIH